MASAPSIARLTGGRRCPAGLIAAIRRVVREHDDWQQTAQQVAVELRRQLPGPQILSPEERRGDPAGYQSYLLHAEADGSFSIVALVWLPGQVTPIHDHVTWCVFGVLQGIEYEEIFALRRRWHGSGGSRQERERDRRGERFRATGRHPPGAQPR